MSKRDDSSPGSKTSTLQVSESLTSKEKDYTSILDTSSRESGISSGKTDRHTDMSNMKSNYEEKNLRTLTAGLLNNIIVLVHREFAIRLN